MQGLAPGILTSGGRQYATWSTTNKSSNITIPAGFGNLNFQTSASATGTKLGNGIATIGKTTDKWYWEITINSASSVGNTLCGVSDSYYSISQLQVGGFTNSIAYRQNNGTLTYCFLKNGVSSGAGCTVDIVAGDVIGFWLNLSSSINPLLRIDINGTQVGTTQSLAIGRTWYPACGANGVSGNGGTANFGASTFIYYTASGAEAAGYNPGIYI